MKGKSSVLSSKYIIDGIRYPVSPKEMLDAAKGLEGSSAVEDQDAIADETIDASPVSDEFSKTEINRYLSGVLADSAKPEVPEGFSEVFTRWTVAKSLIDSIWCCGKFRLEDLSLNLLWQWNTAGLGQSAAFYQSVSALVEYVDLLGVSINDYQFEEGRHCRLLSKAVLSTNHPEESEVPVEEPSQTDDPTGKDLEAIGEQISFHSGSCSLWDNTPFKVRKITKSPRRRCPNQVSGSESSWIIYLPFDTCPFRLGGSKLCKVTGKHAVLGPEVGDADYFIDCYEVIREMVEDGIILAGRTISDGGLLPTLRQFIGTDRGMKADISGVMNAYEEKEMVPVLFGEVPGVLIEISDVDYDYVDAEFLLQDVAYYPLGHVSKRMKSITVVSGESGIAGILQSLMSSQEASEGED